MLINRLRLGARGQYALSRLLSAEELPFEVLGLRFERAYNSRKEYIALRNPSSDYKYQVIAERSFAISGVNRFVNIGLRPYTSDEEVARAHQHFVDIVSKRYAYMNPSPSVTSVDALRNISDVTLVETEGEYMGDNFRIKSFACVKGREMLLAEFQCSASSEWNLEDCETVLRSQLEKIERMPRSNGSST
jgi:hypothetical protein